jgi:hypothetical protein
LIASQYVYHAEEGRLAATQSPVAGSAKRSFRHRPDTRRVL